MLTSPISVTIGADTLSMKRINQDNFGSTYLAKGTGYEARMNVRHSYEGKNANGQYERHNVDLQYTTFDEDGKPTLFQAYAVVRNVRGSSPTKAAEVANGLATFVASIDSEIVDWES